LDQPRAPDEWDVFISYSRKDHEFASRLHAVLNVYQPPRGLPVPQRRLQVFLDTSDYSGPDYKPTIQQHLKNSSKIIVICSPNAVGSRFVGPEIDDFVGLHPPDLRNVTPPDLLRTRSDIIAIITAGLPINETTGLTDPRNAFPDALCRAIALPIAIDYREFAPRQHKLQEGRYHDAWFTLLAEIYGLSRAAIEERERRRRGFSPLTLARARARVKTGEVLAELAYRLPTCDPALSPQSPDEAAILSALTAVRD
jgi:hypothetical protein